VGLQPNTTYSVEVRAYDAAGNYSDWSAPLSATTGASSGNAADELPALWAAQYGLTPVDALGDPDGDGLTNIAEYNLGANPLEYDAGTSTLGNTVPAGWAALAGADGAGGPAAGTTQGKISVDKNGAATYSIPVFAVPGTAGMQPEISLDYNSQSKGGIAGHGWSLGGVSAITRGPKTLAVDGMVSGVEFSREDQYYLDGQRLVCVGGTHSYAGAEYRLEHDNFTRVLAQGSAGNGPEWFRVWTKAGRIMDYGGTADARLLAGNTGQAQEVQTWALSRAADTAGNYMDFIYEKAQSTGEQYLTRINYTGNTAAGLSPYASLRFEYESRADTAFGYVHGVKFSTTKRLKHIRACYNETPARALTLDYIERQPSGRSLLVSVTETGADGKSYPPLTFDYSNPENGWDDPGAAWEPPDLVNHPMQFSHFADVNGDGHPDFITSILGPVSTGIYLNTPDGWVPADGLNGHPAFPLPAGLNDGMIKFVDLNGDGIADILSFPYNWDYPWDSADAYIKTASGYVHSPEWSLPYEDPVTSLRPGSGYNRDSIRIVGATFTDINGDGYVDCMIKSEVNYTNENGGFVPVLFTQIRINQSGSMAPGQTCRWRYANEDFPQADRFRGLLLDVTGEGIPDFCSTYVLTSGVVSSIKWVRSLSPLSGTTWVPRPADLGQPEPVSVGAHLPTEVLDLNNDGLADAVRRNSFSSLPSAPFSGNATWFNTGTGWVQAGTQWQSPIALSDDNGGTGTALLDINNDGAPDVVRAKDDIRSLWYGKIAGGWTAPASGTDTMHLQYPVCLGNRAAYSSLVAIPNYSGSEFVDLNGDGAIDQIWHLGARLGHSSDPHVKGAALNKRVHPDRLVSVTGGLGATASVTYAPLTERDAGGNPTVYQKDFTPADLSDPDPKRNVISPLYVVKTLAHSAPAGDTAGAAGNYSLEYKYGGMRASRLHGSLGFEWLSVRDTRTDIVTTTVYSQDYPTIGRPVETFSRAGGGSGQTLSESTATYGVIPLHSGTTNFVFTKSTEASSYNLDGTLLSKIATDTDPDNDGSAYDAFGNNLLSLATSGTGAGAITTLTERTWQSGTDNGRWLPGLLTGATVTTTQNGASITRENAYAYDDATGLLLSETVEPSRADDPDNVYLLTEYTLDACGNRTAVTVSGGGIAPRVAATTYDTATKRFPVAITNALGQTETRVYDSSLGVPSSITGPNGLITSYDYDGFGRQTGETRADGTQTLTHYRWASESSGLAGAVYVVETESSGGAPSAAVFDCWGRAVHTLALNPGGVAPDNPGGHARIVTTRVEYDSRGLPVRTWLPAYINTAATIGTETEYDILNRPVLITKADDDAQGGTAYVSYAYESLIIKSTDPAGREEWLENDLHGRAVRRVNNATAAAGSAERGEVLYDYDPLGRLTATHVLREDGTAVTTLLTYDLLGRRTAMNDPDVGAWIYACDALGQLLAQTDAKNQTVAMTYDVLGRMTHRADADSETTWTYDTAEHGIGKLHTVAHTATGETDYSEEFAYDELSRPVTNLRTIAGTTYSTGQEYDDYSRPSVMRYPSNFKVRNVYDNLGFLKEVREAGGRVAIALNEVMAGHRFWQAEHWTVTGSIDRASLGNGLTHDRVISNVTGRVKAITSSSYMGGPYVQHQVYLHDLLGQVTQRTDNVLGLQETFAYDGLNRLTSHMVEAASPPLGSGGSGGTGVPPVGLGIVTVAYDALGNITAKSDAGDYTYNSAHPHAVASIANGPLGPQSYAYDANGNLTAGADRAYLWTAANKVRQITQGEQIANFAFDADRQRIRQVREDGTVTTYIGAEYEKVEHAGGLVEIKHYILTPLGRAAVRTERNDGGIETRYFHADGLGTIHAVTDEWGRVEKRYYYDAWGKQTEVTDTHAANAGGKVTRGFTDHEMLDNFGLIHMNARLYDPILGHFISADRIVQDIGNSQTYNRYSYCANNPVNTFDPTGNSFWDYLGGLWNRLFDSGDEATAQQKTDATFSNGSPVGAGVADASTQNGSIANPSATQGIPGGTQPTVTSIVDVAYGNGSTARYYFGPDGIAPPDNLFSGAMGFMIYAPFSVEMAAGRPNIISEYGWSLRQVYRRLGKTKNKEALDVVDALKKMTIIRMDGMDIKHTYPDGKVVTDHYPGTDGTILAGGSVKAQNTIYIYSGLTVLAAIETMYHEGVMHNLRGAKEYYARAEAALFMDRVGLGTQFPQFLRTQTTPSGAANAGSVQQVPDAAAINASISPTYQSISTIDKVYGAKVLQKYP
jgi:RHS repeat-associated protein